MVGTEEPRPKKVSLRGSTEHGSSGNQGTGHSGLASVPPHDHCA